MGLNKQIKSLFEKHLKLGFALIMAVLVCVTFISMSLIRSVVTKKDIVVYKQGEDLMLIENLYLIMEKKVGHSRAYLLTKHSQYQAEVEVRRGEFLALLDQLKNRLAADQTQSYLELVESNEQQHHNELVRIMKIAPRLQTTQIAHLWETKLKPLRDRVDASLQALQSFKIDRYNEAKFDAEGATSGAFKWGLLAGFLSVGLGLLAATLILQSARRIHANSIMIRKSMERSSHLENELRQTVSHLQSSLRVRDEFLSVASHELKTPLTSLRLQIQIFKKKASKKRVESYEKAAIDALLEFIDGFVSRLTRLVDDMLDIARIRSGQLSLHPVACDLNELLRESVDRARPQFRQCGASEPELIKLPHRTEGHWDKFRIEQVLNNLLTNALRYGQGRPIQVGLQDRGDSVVIYVRDQGIGISHENQKKIFDRFERAISANDVSGLGLGLYICRQIVEAHNGTIWVESEPGQGSTFYVQLPRQIAVPHSSQEVAHVA